MKISNEMAMIGAGVGVLLIGAWYLKSKAGEIVQAVPGVVADTAANVVIGTGAVFGIPRTNETECQRALREGRTWDASFACPAGTFLGHVLDFSDWP